MPSLLLSDQKMTTKTPLSDADSIKKKKKTTKIAAINGHDSPDTSSKEKIKGKRKVSDDEEDERSETSSELGIADADLKIGNGSSKKQRLIEKERGGSSEDEDGEVSADGEDEKEADPNAVSNFRISEPLREKLKSKGIESLFPIQAMTFEIVLNGCDFGRTGADGAGKVEDVSKVQTLLFSATLPLRPRIPVLKLLACCVEYESCMETYNNPNVK